MTVDTRIQYNYATPRIRYDPRSNRATVVIVAPPILHAESFKCFIPLIGRWRADCPEDKLGFDIVLKKLDVATTGARVLGTNRLWVTRVSQQLDVEGAGQRERCRKCSVFVTLANVDQLEAVAVAGPRSIWLGVNADNVLPQFGMVKIVSPVVRIRIDDRNLCASLRFDYGIGWYISVE